MESQANSVRFSTFLSTEWEFLNFYTRFSPPRVIFTPKTEFKGSRTLRFQINSTPETFKRCTIDAKKRLKIHVFHTVSATGCLNPLPTVVMSILWVSTTQETTVPCLFKVLRAGTLEFLGAFLANFPLFCNFWALNRHFYHNQRP